MCTVPNAAVYHYDYAEGANGCVIVSSFNIQKPHEKAVTTIMVWPTNKKKKQKYSILTFCSFKTCIGYAFLIHFFFLQNYGLFRTFVTAPRRNDNHWFRFRSRTPEMTVC